MRRFIVFSLLALFILSGNGLIREAQAADIKIGYVDVAAVFDSFDKTKDQDKILSDKSEQKQSKRNSMAESIRNMKNELELLSDKQKDKKQEDIQKEIGNLQDFDLQTKAELKRERDDMVRDILKEIDTTISEYSKKNDYGIVFNSRILVYAQEQYDITREIVNILNSQYRRKK
ncbi:MAG: OmpH family outer membrane protein [Candidatus Omnitrophota bacterium]